MAEIHFDGYLVGKNPASRGGWTVWQRDKYGELIDLPIVNKLIKINLTNNEVELRGCLEACKVASEYDTLITDSNNTILWVKRARKGKQLKARPDLTPIAVEINGLIDEKKLNLEWRPREENLAGIYNEETFHA